MNADPQPEAKSLGMAKLITVVLLALAAYSEVATNHIDSALIGGLVVLALFWAGQAIDRVFPFR